jgi:hypothetical protein
MTDTDQPNEGELILYQTQEGTVRIEVLYESETFWLNQTKIAELFGVDVRTISEHFRNIFASGELNEISVLRKSRTTASDGKSYSVNFYNLGKNASPRAGRYGSRRMASAERFNAFRT